MALIKCNECGNKISDKATSCPSCGHPVKVKKSGCINVIVLLVVIFGIFLSIGACSSSNSNIASPIVDAENSAKREAAAKIAKDNFEKTIEDSYLKLISLKNEGKLNDAQRIAHLFSKYKHEDYKDVTAAIKELKKIDALKAIESNPSNNQVLAAKYTELAKLYPENKDYASSAEQYISAVREDGRIKAEERARVQAAQARQAKIQSQFSAWDGSYSPLERIIKKTMNDPDSYSHVETRYGDKGDHLLIQTTFRGKNGFGALVKNTVIAKFTIEGQLLEIIQDH